MFLESPTSYPENSVNWNTPGPDLLGKWFYIVQSIIKIIYVNNSGNFTKHYNWVSFSFHSLNFIVVCIASPTWSLQKNKMWISLLGGSHHRNSFGWDFKILGMKLLSCLEFQALLLWIVMWKKFLIIQYLKKEKFS